MSYIYLLLSCICLLANPSEESHKVFGQCIDNFTTNPVDTGIVVLMSQDNVPLDSVSISKTSKGKFSFIVNKVGRYGVKVYSNNYETAYQSFEVRSKREEFVYVKTIRMEKKAIQLEDVVVKASKIKMVFMGDTIVYNSDAFNLADGSMLQDLIKELPGASINDNGQIYINGRFVQSLMINGKDFFGGNPMVALQNLPAYTVSKIKVFDQEGRNTHMMKRNMGDNQYTMDVKLKKEYSKGYMGNLEAGIGTDSRYRIKGFGMRSTEVSDLIGFMSMNNLNETSSASSGGRWRNISDVKGLKDIKSVGLSYRNTFDKLTRSWYGNSLIYTYTDDNLLEKMNRQTFYETGDLYSKSTSENQTKLHDVTYTGNLEIGGTAFTMMGDVKAKYTNKKRNGSYNLESMQNTKLLNNMNSLDQGEEKYYFFDTRLQGGIKHISDMIGYNFNVNYDNLNSTGFNMHDINYQASSRDYLHRYMEMPNHHFHINSYIDYNYHLKLIDIIPNYNFTYEHGNTKNALYRLDKISTVDSTLLNMLPSAVDELNQVIDSVNTYRYTDQLLSHSLGIEFKWRPSFLGNRGELNFQPRVVIIHKDINYFRKKDYNLTVNNVFFSPNIYVSKYWGNYSLTLSYRLNHSVPSLDKMIDYYDDSDPLHIQIGNSSLKNSHQFDASTSLIYYGDKIMYSLEYNYTRRDNDIAYSSGVDQNGIMMTQPVNVDGNYYMDFKFNFNKPLDKNKKWNLDNKFITSYRHSVDMNYIVGMSKSEYSIVHNVSAEDNVLLKYRINDNTNLGMNLSGTVNRINSERANFKTITAGEYVWGINATTELFWNLRFSTDLNHCNRYGYQVAEMNTHNLVWNAYLSRSFFSGKLVANLECIDLLHQLSNIQYMVDAQGRTETWNNSIPRSVMFSLIWKLNSNKKKKGE